MSAADRIVIRTLGGEYRSVRRRIGLGMISAGRATLISEPAAAPVSEDAPPQPHDDEHQVQTLGGEPVSVPRELVEVDHPELHSAAAGLTLQTLANEPLMSESQEQAMVQALADPTPYPPEMVAMDDDYLPPLPVEPKPTALRGVWADYATSLGVEVTGDMTKAQIRDAAQDAAQSLANLPQPALVGGRLETPEDEPVTEESVTDDEDPRT